jgi:NAD(P)-dependent dehydrogenase (short-subunit alcohol dehydrogenase family)
MPNKNKVIVTRASQGIGAAVVHAFLDRGYHVVASSRCVCKAGFVPSPNLALVHKNSPKEFLKSLSPMGTISDAKEIADAVVFPTEARQITGEVLRVDGGAQVGKW